MNVHRDFSQIQAELKRLFGEHFPRHLKSHGEVIRNARRERGWSQSQLAAITGVDQPAISKIESNSNAQSDIFVLFVVANALGLGLPDVATLPEALELRITSDRIEALATRILEIARIKTLIKPEADSDVRDIYYRAVLLEEREEGVRRIEATKLKDLEHTACVIQGYAGQGKSILLKYLATQEAIDRTSVPVFIELRGLQGETIQDIAFKRLHNWGLCETRDDLIKVLAEGNVSLLLDAFDEVPPELRQVVATELAELHETLPSLRMIITSRPASGITVQQWLRLYTVAELTPADIQPLICKYANKDEAERINQIISESHFPLPNVIRSPLLVVLLVIHFRYVGSIPDTTIAFYRDLVDVLIRRHNISETGPKRQPRSNMDSFQLRQAFESLSFIVEKDHGDSLLHMSDLETAMKNALARLMRSDFQERLVLDDLMSITNLILEADGYCFFAHKSIREYGAAVVIKDATGEQAERFYASALRSPINWLGVINFLLRIDRYRCIKFFALKDLERFRPFDNGSSIAHFGALEIFGSEEAKRRTLTLTDSISPTMRQERIQCEIPKEQGFLEKLFGKKAGEHIHAELENTGGVRLRKGQILEGHTAANWENTKVAKLFDASLLINVNALYDLLKVEVGIQENKEGEFDF